MRRFIAEFEKQSFMQIIFPHKNTDWSEYLEEAQQNFVAIIQTITKYQKCRVICANILETQQHFRDTTNIEFIEYETDDTWARDCSALSIEEDGAIKLLDFTFTGWGGKFEATKDNLLTPTLYKEAIKCNFILEGGGIETNGEGILLTTTQCMLNPNRNNLTKEQTTQKLKEFFGAKEVLYLENGYLAGDDTDSHIDTLARFIAKDTIMYIECNDEKDEHFKALSAMKKELEFFAKKYNFKLIALPMTPPIYYDNERLPATYANFLFVNGAVLVPTYNVKTDEKALEIFKQALPHLDVIAIDCSVLIRQHGSLHCVTMNFA